MLKGYEGGGGGKMCRIERIVDGPRVTNAKGDSLEVTAVREYRTEGPGYSLASGGGNCPERSKAGVSGAQDVDPGSS